MNIEPASALDALIRQQIYNPWRNYRPNLKLRQVIQSIFEAFPNEWLTLAQIMIGVENLTGKKPNPISVSSTIRDLRRKGGTFPNLRIDSLTEPTAQEHGLQFKYRYVPADNTNTQTL